MIYIGTSGWQYEDWRGRFYPRHLPKSSWLDLFAQRFPTVEVNNSFYRLPAESAFVRWREIVPPGFVVTVKANRFITHIKRLKDCADPLALFWSRAALLGDRLGVVLFQLPPRFKADHDRLREFCALLPDEMRAAIEFRDETWETDETYEILDDAGAAFVLADWPGYDAPDVLCGSWSYIRFHKGGPMRPGYSRTKLVRWTDRIAAMDARDVYIYFNNDTGGAALRDAVTLTTLLEDRGVPVAGPQDRRGITRRAG